MFRGSTFAEQLVCDRVRTRSLVFMYSLFCGGVDSDPILNGWNFLLLQSIVEKLLRREGQICIPGRAEWFQQCVYNSVPLQWAYL